MNVESAAPYEAERPRLLLVEDDSGVRRSIQLLLQARGFDVRAYAEGSALLSDPGPQMAVGLIADYRLPELEGLSVLRSLRATGWDGPAILITAYPSEDLTELAKAAGYDAVLEKPLAEHLLVETTLRLLGRRRGDGSTVPP
ncbi:response regulator [Sphingomonas oleivorans]|uniref:Response regulator n=1 Tax=Sphingomonas oleivorans TaxID=1735121 RepID=A0A2T5FYM1_9SPHN|nr:response regulator [Sphingomonas oleivorans]PTQ11584.1 response regulator [Sphingomonas oleivorans]